MGIDGILRAAQYRCFSDIDVWEVTGPRHAVDALRPHKWRKPLQTEAGIYVLADRLFRRPICYRFDNEGGHVEHSREMVDLPMVFGVPGIEALPPETISYDLTTRVTHAAFAGEVAYQRYEAGDAIGRIVLADSTVLQGKLLDVPAWIRHR